MVRKVVSGAFVLLSLLVSTKAWAANDVIVSAQVGPSSEEYLFGSDSDGNLFGNAAQSFDQEVDGTDIQIVHTPEFNTSFDPQSLSSKFVIHEEFLR